VANISIKKNIPVAFGEVKQTVNIRILIAIIVNAANAPAAIEDRCRDQCENSLIKTFYILL